MTIQKKDVIPNDKKSISVITRLISNDDDKTSQYIVEAFVDDDKILHGHYSSYHDAIAWHNSFVQRYTLSGSIS